MTEGITRAGEFASSDGPTPNEAIELVCTDPNFLEKAADKKPNAVIRAVQGAYSHPRDWWVGILWCNMAVGMFGGEAQTRARGWGRDLRTILVFAENNPSLAAGIVGLHTRHKASSSPEFYGRLAGGAFTNYASTGGRIGGRILNLGVKGKVGRTLTNFFLASLGAAILTVKYGARDIASVMDSMLTGNYRSGLDNNQYKEMFRTVIENDLSVSEEEEQALLEVARGVLDCIDNPGKYAVGGGRSEPQVTPHVPVGSVSSARPDGVRGSIPRGYETNALDVIGDRNARLRTTE